MGQHDDPYARNSEPRTETERWNLHRRNELVSIALQIFATSLSGGPEEPGERAVWAMTAAVALQERADDARPKV